MTMIPVPSNEPSFTVEVLEPKSVEIAYTYAVRLLAFGKHTLCQPITTHLVNEHNAEYLSAAVLFLDRFDNAWNAAQAWHHQHGDARLPTLDDVAATALDFTYSTDWRAWPGSLRNDLLDLVGAAYADNHHITHDQWDKMRCPAITNAGTRCRNMRPACTAHNRQERRRA